MTLRSHWLSRLGSRGLDNRQLLARVGAWRTRMRPAVALWLLLLGGLLSFSKAALADASGEPLSVRLEQIRNDPDLSNDPAVLERLAVQAGAAPGSSIRADARMVVAEAWLGRLHRTNDALALLRLVADDAAADSLTRRLAEREIVDTLVMQGRVQSAALELRAHESDVDARFARQIRRLERRLWLRVGAVAELVLFAALAALALLRAKRRSMLGAALDTLRGFAPTALASSAFVAIVGGTLASQFETGNAAPFLLLGAALAPLVLLGRAWSAVGSGSVLARVGRGTVCAASMLAAAFVLLGCCSPMYLESFGL